MLSRSVSMRLGVGVGVITVILALVLAVRVAPALADGDPASDVLTTQPLFDPPDAHVPYAVEARLDAVLKAAARVGFPIRVALVDSGTDLGTVAPLWSKPADKRAGSYAVYLGSELSQLYHGQVLVVMPGGYGLYGPAHGGHSITAAEQQIDVPTPRNGVDLATSAMAAVKQLAKAAGHPIEASDVHVDAAITHPPGTPVTVWLALGLGGLIIAAAWWLSLRARPLGSGRRGVRA